MMNTKEKKAKSKPKYACLYLDCKKVFDRPHKMEYHMKTHTGERSFKCDVENCGKSYFTSSHLIRHKKVSHNPGAKPKFPCEICKSLFSNSWSVKLHVRRAHSLEKFRFACEHCEQRFSQEHKLKEHLFTHTGIPPYECDRCSVFFINMQQYNKHIYNHRSHFCKKCGIMFETWPQLLEHRIECSVSEPKCSVCHKQFSSQSNLNSHMGVHKEERDVLECPYYDCPRYYFYKRNLDYHVKYVHLKKTKKKFDCPIPECGRKLSKKQNLIQHIALHEREKKPRKPQKPRKDKGAQRKCTALMLSGLETGLQNESKIAANENVEILFTNEGNEDVIMNEDVITSDDC